MYLGSDELVLTGRSMDWAQDMCANLWIFPQEIKRDSAAGKNSISWVSKYGSLIVSAYEAGTADGMNEKGLVANLLYLAESDYGNHYDNTPLLSTSVWAQYVLDNFATVAESVEALSKESFQIAAPVLPNDCQAQLHLSLSDSRGDSAILEYIAGKLTIHHGKQYQVMTNSPCFRDQLALNTYWESVGGLAFLPGTHRASDRFVRATFLNSSIPKTIASSYINAVVNKDYAYQAIASLLGVMRSVSVPLGVTTPDQPNIASTLWRTLADHKNRVYFFDSATTPNTFWVNLNDIDFKPGAPIKKLELEGGKIYSGNTASYFNPTRPFVFLSVDDVAHT